MAECDGPNCTDQVVWAVTLDGKRQPFNRDPDPDGNRVLLGRGPHKAPLAVPVAMVQPCPDEVIYMPHHATCVDAERFRSPRS